MADQVLIEGISIFLHYEWFVNPKSIVFDLRGIAENNSPIDVSRVLLQLSEMLKANDYERVILAFKGQQRFVLQGRFFKTTGEEYGVRNPAYTLRNLPQNVHKLDGTAAFSTWRGGLLGVLSKQMNDLNSFHEQ